VVAAVLDPHLDVRQPHPLEQEGELVDLDELLAASGLRSPAVADGRWVIRR
jgi:hypothetical protein